MDKKLGLTTYTLRQQKADGKHWNMKAQYNRYNKESAQKVK